MTEILTNQIKLSMYTSGTGPAVKALQSIIDFILKKENKSLEEFLNEHQHSIYHLYTSGQCCQCKYINKARPWSNTKKSKIYEEQMHELFLVSANCCDRLPGHNIKYNKLPCCCKAKQVKTEELDITIMKIFLKNFFSGDIWDIVLSGNDYNNSLTKFLDCKAHEIFHLLESNDKVTCCACQKNRGRPSRRKRCSIGKKEFNSLYDKCEHYDTCALKEKCALSYEASIVSIQEIKDNSCFPSLYSTLLRSVNPLYISISDIADVRNKHSHRRKIPDCEYGELLELLKVSVQCIATYLRIELQNDIEEIKSIDGIRRLYTNNNDLMVNGIRIFVEGLNDLYKIISSQEHPKLTTSLPELYRTDSKSALKNSNTKEAMFSESSELKLIENCIKLGYIFDKPTTRNGNCFFEAVSRQLHKVNLPYMSAEELRHRVVEFVTQHPTLDVPNGTLNLADFLHGRCNSIEGWVDEMCKDGTFIDNVGITAMSKMLQKKICVVTSSEQSNPENCLISFDFGPQTDCESIVLGHVFENHYESLIPVEEALSKLRSADTQRQELHLQNICRAQEQHIENAIMSIKYIVKKGILSRRFLQLHDSNGEEIYQKSEDLKLSENNEIPVDDDSSADDHPPDIFRCCICSKEFLTMVALEQHKETEHSDRKMKRKRKENNLDANKQTKAPRLVGKWMLTLNPTTDSWERKCKNRIDLHIEDFGSENMKVLFSEYGCLVVWTGLDHSAAKSRKKLVESTDKFMKNLFEKCPVEEETTVNVELKIEHILEEDETEKDVYVCGRCRKEYNDSHEFYVHKRECKRRDKRRKQLNKIDKDNETDVTNDTAKKGDLQNDELVSELFQPEIQENIEQSDDPDKLSCNTSGYGTDIGYDMVENQKPDPLFESKGDGAKDRCIQWLNDSGRNRIADTILQTDISEKNSIFTTPFVAMTTTSDLDFRSSQVREEIQLDERTRCLHCVNLVMNLFPQILQKIMESKISPERLFKILQTDLKFKRKRTQSDCKSIQTLLTDGFKKLDMTIMFKIIHHFSDVFTTPPTRGWASDPQPNEITIGDDLQRLRLIRNHFFHKVRAMTSEAEYNDFFEKVKAICKRLDAHLNLHGKESFTIFLQSSYVPPLERLLDIEQAYTEQKSLKEFLVLKINDRNFTVFQTWSIKDSIRMLTERLEGLDKKETVIEPITLTFPEAMDPEVVRQIEEELKESLGNIKLKRVTEG